MPEGHFILANGFDNNFTNNMDQKESRVTLICLYRTSGRFLPATIPLQAQVPIIWLADGDSLMCYIVRMSRLIA